MKLIATPARAARLECCSGRVGPKAETLGPRDRVEMGEELLELFVGGFTGDLDVIRDVLRDSRVALDLADDTDSDMREVDAAGARLEDKAVAIRPSTTLRWGTEQHSQMPPPAIIGSRHHQSAATA